MLARGGAADDAGRTSASSAGSRARPCIDTVRSQGSKSGSGTDSLVGSVMGTPAYMPPEQAAGHVDRLDERSDVFSLGAILCEILTGEPPYPGESENTLAAAAQAKLEPALERLDSCGAEPELVEITKQCLLPAAGARPRNAAVMAERIHEHVVSLEERAQAARVEAAEARVRAKEERRARKLTAALALAVLGIGVAGGGGWLWVQNERAVRERESAARERETAARERDLVARVNASLNDASAFLGQERWGDAFAALDRADALADTVTADPDVRAGIDALRARVTDAADSARVGEERARAAADFVARLDDIGRSGGAGEALFDWPRFDRDYALAFRENGIDVDASTPEAVVAALYERGLGTELVSALDRWLIARRNVSRDQANSSRDRREDLSPCVRLVDITNELDRDPLRADLREALLNDDLEMIQELAASDLHEQPASTIVLLGTALRMLGQRSEALRVLREGVCRLPQSYGILAALLDTLPLWGWGTAWNTRDSVEASRYLRAALVLRPNSRPLRGLLFWQLLHQAIEPRLRGDLETSRALYDQAVDELHALIYEYAGEPYSEDALIPEVVADEYNHLGLALEGAGESERALVAFRQFASPEMLVMDRQGLKASFAVTWHAQRAGNFLARAGDLEAARRCFQFALDHFPEATNTARDLAFTDALLRVRDGGREDVVAALEAAGEDHPGDVDGMRNGLAWRVVRWPRDVLRRACAPREAADAERVERNLDALIDEALRLSEQATAADGNPGRWNTLGVVRYRLGDDEGCVRALQEAVALRDSAFDAYPLALAHARLGHDDEARRWYEHALARTTIGFPGDLERANELLWFKAEAEVVFGAGVEREGR